MRPYAIQVLVAFATPALSGTPSWTDVTDDVLAFTTSRGRSDELAVIQPGTATLVLDNISGDYEPDNTAGPRYGDLRPNRRVRISAQATSGSTMTPVWDGYVDSWTTTLPNGAVSSRIVTVECTDRFKMLARRSNTGTTVQEFAAARVTAILENGGVDPIIGAAYRNINPGGYATRTLVAYVYDGVNTLQALNDVALSDGGAMFMDPVGVFTFQGTRYRTDNTRATVSQGTFGNTATAIPVENDLDPSVSDDIMANRVTVTCGDGSVDVAEDTAAQAEDGLLELDIGNTLLRALDGPDRAADVLLLRKDPRPRYRSVTIDCTTSDAAMVQALAREISDRITIAVIPPGAAQGYSRDQYVESIEHDVSVTDGTWRTTFSVSGGYGGATVIYPAGVAPGSNSLAGAVVIPPGGGSYDFNNAGSSAEAGETHGGDGWTLWWKWTPAASGTATVRTSDSPGDPDTYLTVFSGDGTFAGLTVVAQDDDSGNNPAVGDPVYGSSIVTFACTASTTYYVQVDSFTIAVAGVLTVEAP